MDLMSLQMLESIDNLEHERLKKFKAAWEAYEGDMPRPVKVELGKPDDNVILPFLRSFIHTGVHFLFGDDLEFSGENEKADEYVDRCWSGGRTRGNQKMLTLTKLGINGAVTGQTFVKLSPQDGYVRIINLDPSYVSVTWSMEDYEEVSRYRLEWPIIDERGKPAVRRQDHERATPNSWTISDYISRGYSSKWEQIGTENWPYEFAAIVETQNLPKPNEYWGESDLDGGLFQINNAINAVFTDIKKILRYHASPKTIAKGIAPDVFKELNVAPDSMIFLPDDGQEIDTIELAGDLKASLDTYGKLKEALHQVAAIPEVATGKVDNVGQLSARAMAILYKPLVDLTSTKRMTYGHQIDEINRRSLVIGGLNEDDAPNIVWPEILPRDDAEERTVAEADIRMGVSSKQTQSEKLGYDWDQEEERISEERQSSAEFMLTQFDQGNTQGADGMGQFAGTAGTAV